MSLRAIAKELETSPAYLSYMINGKRPWRKDLYQRYLGVVNTFVNSGEDCTSVQESEFAELDTKNGVPGRIRTRDPLLGLNNRQGIGFQKHRALVCPALSYPLAINFLPDCQASRLYLAEALRYE